MYNNYPELFNELITHLRSSKGCASNSQKMLDILQKLDNIPNGMITLLRYLSKEFPFIIINDGPIPQQTVQPVTDIINENRVFEFYDSEILTYPHKVIMTSGNLQSRINELIADKPQSDHIIINNVAYVEYLNHGETANANSWEIRKYRVSQNPTNRPIRFGLIYPTFAMGGVEQYTISMCKALFGKVEFSGLGIIGNPWYGYGPSCVELSNYMPVYGGPNNDSYVKPDAGVIQLESDKDVVDIIMNNSDIIMVWAIHQIPEQLLKWNGKLLTISHGGGKWSKEWLDKIADKCHTRVAVSNHAAEIYKNQNDVKIIPAGVDHDRLIPSASRSELRKEFGIDGLAIGYIGRFSSEKNCEYIAKIIGSMDDAVGVFYGVGWWLQDEFSNNVNKYSNNKVKYFDPGYHIGDILRVIDCLVVASPIEGGPIVAIEAWMAGVPLVSTDVGVVKSATEVVGDVASIIKLNDINGSIDAIRYAVSDEFKPIVEKAKAYALKNYNLVQFGSRWFQLLSEMANESRR